VLASSALLLCGCASPPNSEVAPAPLARTLPDTCERILKRDPLPAIKPTDDARAAFLKDDAALITANGRIDAGRGCVHDMRQRYSGQKD
jgi:hypothetical protein